jgi:hypothetical protein
MADYRTQVSIPMDSNVGADTVVNNWHFFDNGLSGPTATQKIESWHNALQTFYNSISVAIFPNIIDHTAVRMKTYDLDLPIPRIPLVDEVTPITAPTGTASLPHELCIVLSFRSALQSGISPARRRGRVFLGPLQQSGMMGAEADPKIVAGKLTTIANAATVLMTGPTPDEGWDWATRSSFPAANGVRNVVAGWVDNSFDIQRSRGTVATTRTTF